MNVHKRRLTLSLLLVTMLVVVLAFSVRAFLSSSKRVWPQVENVQVFLDGKTVPQGKVYRSKDGHSLLVDVKFPNKRTMSYINFIKKSEGQVYMDDLDMEGPGFVLLKRSPPNNDHMPDEMLDLPEPNLKIQTDAISFQTLLGRVEVTGFRSHPDIHLNDIH